MIKEDVRASLRFEERDVTYLIAHTDIGRYVIEVDKGIGCFITSPDDDYSLHGCFTRVEDAIEACNEHYRRMLMQAQTENK